MPTIGPRMARTNPPSLLSAAETSVIPPSTSHLHPSQRISQPPNKNGVQKKFALNADSAEARASRVAQLETPNYPPPDTDLIMRLKAYVGESKLDVVLDDAVNDAASRFASDCFGIIVILTIIKINDYNKEILPSLDG